MKATGATGDNGELSITPTELEERFVSLCALEFQTANKTRSISQTTMEMESVIL